MVAPEDEASRYGCSCQRTRPAGRRCLRRTTTVTATTVTAFWQPQHSQKTEIEKEEENRTKKYSPNIGTRGWCSRRGKRLVAPEDKPGRPGVFAQEDEAEVLSPKDEAGRPKVLAPEVVASEEGTRRWSCPRRRKQRHFRFGKKS